MKPKGRNVIYFSALASLVVVALVLQVNQRTKKFVPSAPGYVSGWFACKSAKGWLCREDGAMKPNPNWIGERDPDPRGKPARKLPPGPEK